MIMGFNMMGMSLNEMNYILESDLAAPMDNGPTAKEIIGLEKIKTLCKDYDIGYATPYTA